MPAPGTSKLCEKVLENEDSTCKGDVENGFEIGGIDDSLLPVEIVQQVPTLDEIPAEEFNELPQHLKESLKKELLAEVQSASMEHMMRVLPDLIQEHLMKNIAEIAKEINNLAGNPPSADTPPKRDFGRGGSLARTSDLVSESGRGQLSRSGSRLVADQNNAFGVKNTNNSVGELCKVVHADGLPILDASANELGAQDWVYNWSETMWDAMPFLGLGVMTISDSVLVALIALLNLVIQATFVGLVGSNMTESLFHHDEVVHNLLDWRVSYAHNPDFADKFTSTPLGFDVCSQSTFLMQGAQQASLYQEIQEYIQTFLGMSAGACLAELSIFLWILTCCKEMKRIILFTVGLWTSNHEDGVSKKVARSYVVIQERSVLWVYGEATQKNYQLFLTTSRVVMLTITVILPRLVVLVALGSVGTNFLVATTELDELILNCVALEVVLHVDEMLFTIFVPDSAARMVRKTKPLRVPKLRGNRARIMPWLRVSVVTMLMLYISLFSLQPLINTMTEVERVMCGGNVDFLAREMQFGAVVSGTPKTIGIDRQEYRYRAIYQRTGLDQASAAVDKLYMEGQPFEFSRVQSLDVWRARGMEEWASLAYDDPMFTSCSDRYWVWFKNQQLASAFWAGVSAKTGIQINYDAQLSGCAQIKHLCFTDASDVGKSVRLMCPQTCGARDAVSGLLMDLTVDGTPTGCSGWFARSLHSLPCTDYSLAELTNTSDPIGQGWRNYETSVVSMMSSTFMGMSEGNLTHFQVLKNTLWAGMSTQGCNFFSRQSPTRGKVMFATASGVQRFVDFCDVSDILLFGRRSIRPFCPQTCECDTSVKQRYSALGEAWSARTGKESQCPAACWAR